MKNKNSTQPFVDDYIRHQDDICFTSNGALVEFPFDVVFGEEKLKIMNPFMMKKKKAYNEPELQETIIRYINYFMKYYDPQRFLITGYLQMKFLTDNSKNEDYDADRFINDLMLHILNEFVLDEAWKMVEDNYQIELAGESHKIQKNNESLQFTNEHGKVLMLVSLCMKIAIPIANHYTFIRNIKNFNRFFVKLYDSLINKVQGERMDIYTKLYETVYSRIVQRAGANQKILDDNKIKGLSIESFTADLMQVLMLNGIPKYTFNGNVVSMNTAIINGQIDIFLKAPYTHNYNPFSEVERDEDGLSDFDKIEINIAKEDESEIIIRRINIAQTLARLEGLYGEPSEDEIEFYQAHSSRERFQLELTFDFFAKYFGSTSHLYSCNHRDYIRLLILMKKLLEGQGFVYLQYIFTAHVKDKTSIKRSLNKNQIKKSQESNQYNQLMERKYRDTRSIIEKGEIFPNHLTSILANEYEWVDYDHQDCLYASLKLNKEIIQTEYMRFVDLI